MNSEQNAKGLWCPFASNRVAQTKKTAWIFANEHGEASTTCIASSCMAWRCTQSGKNLAGDQLIEPQGYCGLAGKP